MNISFFDQANFVKYLSDNKKYNFFFEHYVRIKSEIPFAIFLSFGDVPSPNL